MHLRGDAGALELKARADGQPRVAAPAPGGHRGDRGIRLKALHAREVGVRPVGRPPGGCARTGGAGPYAVSPVIPSPISFAAMMRHSTAMIAALFAAIQSLSAARIRSDRLRIAK
jgi:hypothetical protein